MKELIQNLCHCTNLPSISDIIQIALALITLVVTINIPIQIMKYQRYQNLVTTYMSFEFAHAVQSLISFFYDECNCDVDQIPSKYMNRFEKDMKSMIGLGDNIKGNPSSVLHYQRRFLNNFFMELEMCRESSWLLHRKIVKEWTSNEALIVKILIYMNETVKNNPEIFKDLSCLKHERMPKTKGMSEYLEKFYNIMKNQPKYMRM